MRRVNQISKMFGQFSGRIDKRELFTDFLWLVACRMSNRVDVVHREERHKTAKKIAEKYTDAELKLFADIMVQLFYSVCECINTGNYEDILGRVFEELNLRNKHLGQDLTPPSIARIMAKIVVREATGEVRTVNDPTCGGGMLVLSLAEEMTNNGQNYCTEMAVLAQDIDMRCVLMSYIQLSIYGIPAVVLRADTMLVQEHDRWYTPMYIHGDWVWRQPFGITNSRNWDDELLRIAGHPMYGAIRYPELFFGNPERK